MPRRSVRPAAIVLALSLSLGAAAGCGEDPPTKADFVDRLQAITNPPLDRPIAECAYDALDGRDRLMNEAMTKSDSGDEANKLSAKDRKALTEIMAECVLSSATTTTAPDGE